MSLATCEKISLATRGRLLLGVMRRFFLAHFRPGYVRRQIARRQGACSRCGACCHLTCNCPFLETRDDASACKLYQVGRMPNCVVFPIDQRDIADRDRVAPTSRCGYFWPDDDAAAP